MPRVCATIIRKTLEELFISRDFCSSNLHNQLLFLQWITAHLNKPLNVHTSPTAQPKPASPGALHPAATARAAENVPVSHQGGREHADRECHKLAGSLSRVAGLCQIMLLSPKLEAERATRKSGESCLSRKQEAASQCHCVRQHLKASC